MELTPGKRYRWTVEGTAIDRYDEEFPEHRIDLVYGGEVGFLTSDEASWGTLELLPDPLPTTPGSVVRDRNGTLVFIGAHGPMSCGGAALYPVDMKRLAPFTVLFDAGAER